MRLRTFFPAIRFGLVLIMALLAIPAGWILFGAFRTGPPSVIFRQRVLVPDLGQRSTYRDVNTRKPCAPGCTVFFGDSITQSWNLDSSFPGRPFVNRGIAGQTTDQMLLRFRQDVVDLGPSTLVLEAGVNDLYLGLDTRTIEENYQSFADLAAANRIRLVFATVLPVNAQSPHSIKAVQLIRNESIRSLNQWLQTYCRERQIALVDYVPFVSDADGRLRSDFTDDGIHPNRNGYAAMTLALQSALASEPLPTKP